MKDKKIEKIKKIIKKGNIKISDYRVTGGWMSSINHVYFDNYMDAYEFLIDRDDDVFTVKLTQFIILYKNKYYTIEESHPLFNDLLDDFWNV